MSKTVTALREQVKTYKCRYEYTKNERDKARYEKALKELQELIKSRREEFKKGNKPKSVKTKFQWVLKKEHLARTELADLSGVGIQTLNSLSTGKKAVTNCTMSTLLKILEALGGDIKLTDLMEDSEKEIWAKYL